MNYIVMLVIPAGSKGNLLLTHEYTYECKRLDNKAGSHSRKPAACKTERKGNFFLFINVSILIIT